MANQWAKSVSYRQAIDGLTERFQALAKQDRVATHELMPSMASIDGYLFAINAAPANISPTEWLGDLLPLVQIEGENPAETVNMVISYAIHCKARMEQQKYAVPEESDPLKALSPGSALNCFSTGFELGYQKIASVWSASIAEELRKELDSQVFALRFFSSTEHAKKYLKERNSPMRPDQLAEQVLKNLPTAADLHVRLGMAVEAEKGVSH